MKRKMKMKTKKQIQNQKQNPTQNHIQYQIRCQHQNRLEKLKLKDWLEKLRKERVQDNSETSGHSLPDQRLGYQS
jgi:hypothetical protein